MAPSGLHDMGRLRPRRPVHWLVLVLGFLLISSLFWHTRDHPFTRQIPWFTSHELEDNGPLEDPYLCRIFQDTPATAATTTNETVTAAAPASGGIAYTCLGRRPQRISNNSSDVKGLKPAHNPMPTHCIDAHFAKGEPCSAELSSPPKLDVVWIWANGSDPMFRSAIEDAEDSMLGPDAGKSKVSLKKGAKLYRDHDELRYSLRSVLQHFSAHAANFHLVTTDVGDGLGNRFGILPQWLDTNASLPWKDGNVKLNIVHHSQVFENLDNSTFNSFSIESQLYGLTSASEPFIYMNDDFFFTRDLITTDFYSSAYGVVLRLDPGLSVTSAEWPTDNPSGEWQPLKYSNWLLSERFGERGRPYMIHVAKTISPSILQEINQIWTNELADTALHRFRGQRDVYTIFLHGHYLVERWREILLWSWVIGKIAGDDNTWTQDDADRAWEEIGGTIGFETAYVNQNMRGTLEKQRVRNHFEKAGEPLPRATRFFFSNLDGYPYALTYDKPREWPEIALGVDGNVNDAAPDWGRKHWAKCQVVRSQCFPPGASATEIFHNVAFLRSASCGDCIIQALVSRTGRLGLEAFLPPPHRIHYSNVKGRVVEDVDPQSIPRLPLVKRPKDTSFAMKDVLREWGTVRVRDWILRAMERYRFVVADTPSHFGMLSSPRAAQRLLQTIDSNPDLALLTINDDVVTRPEEVDRLFRTFLDRRWSYPSAWENVRAD